MKIDIGMFSLVVAFLLSVYGIVAGSIGASKNNNKLIVSTRNALYLQCFFCVTALVCLAIAFLKHDYSNRYVWQHSNNDMHPMYLVSAIWGGMDGSMLLWAVIMSVYAFLVVYRNRDVSQAMHNWVLPILSASICFFLCVVTLLTNPFRVLPGEVFPADGKGLNPLLQNPSMMIHPPTLYLGFTGFVVPFAFALAALLSRDISDRWISATRRWTLVAWGFLTIGIILGGNWAYIELGWGGFWAWDPVENASFLPWLSGTALLHSMMVQERRGMLKIWNVSLSILTYLLTVFGTFLTRSGVVQSVHAFAETDVGWVFLLYMGIVVVGAVILIINRLPLLKSENKIESFFSREAAFLLNNLCLLGICFATFWGVMFPIFSEAATGEQNVLGPPFYDKVNIPIFLALLFLMGAGPLLSWRKSTFKLTAKIFVKPFAIGSALTLFLLYVDPTRVSAAVAFGLSLFALLAVEGEMRRAVKARREISARSYPGEMITLLKRKPRRYGGLIVHVGVAIMAIAITGSMAYKTERDFSLGAGERFSVGRFVLQMDKIEETETANYKALAAHVSVFDQAGKFLGMLEPERRYYPRSDETTTEVDIRVSPRDDLYLALAGLDLTQAAPGQAVDVSKARGAFKVFVNPLQVWLWFGSMFVLFGTVLVLVPGLSPDETRSETPSEAPVRIRGNVQKPA